MKSFIFASDLHGIEQKRSVVKVFKKFVDEFDKDSFRVFGGDLWNLAALRRQAADHEKSIRLKEDFLAGLEFLEWYRPKVLILGNHDARLWDAVSIDRIKHSGWKAELAQSYIDSFSKFVTKLDIKVLSYDKRRGVYKHGGLSFAHGFGSGNDLTRKMAETYGNVLVGHGHKIERVTAMHSGGPVTGYQVGCLCRDDMDYTRADLGTLRQQAGWAYGFFAPQLQVFQAQVIGGKAVVASDFKVI